MNRSVSIRQAQLDDAGLIAPLFNAYRVFYQLPPNPDGAYEFIRERLSQEDSIILMALDQDGHALGFTQLYPSFSSLRMCPTFILNDLYVGEAYRELGVGELLVKACISLARESGARALNLETGSENFPAQRLYAKLGFELDEAFYHYELEISS